MPLPKLKITGATIAEGNDGLSKATVTVQLSRASTEVVMVNYATANITAIAGNDYIPVNGVLTFAIGETSKTIDISVLGDTLLEASEKFTVRLTTPINATLDTVKSATVTISNDDSPVVFDGWDTPITEDADNVATTLTPISLLVRYLKI